MYTPVGRREIPSTTLGARVLDSFRYSTSTQATKHLPRTSLGTRRCGTAHNGVLNFRNQKPYPFPLLVG